MNEMKKIRLVLIFVLTANILSFIAALFFFVISQIGPIIKIPSEDVIASIRQEADAKESLGWSDLQPHLEIVTMNDHVYVSRIEAAQSIDRNFFLLLLGSILTNTVALWMFRRYILVHPGRKRP